MDKAKINKIVKKIKKMRADSEAKKNEPKKATFAYQVSGSAEKTLMGLGIAAGLAVIFDESKKRAKNPAKAHGFIKRTTRFYKMLGGLLDSTVAQQLKIDNERQFIDETLEKLEIEDGIKFDPKTTTGDG
ncbi:MAG: hypothetical protein K6B74_03820 [Ruminococcus sp.]|nr:hypothetical protein [Ruminococcus sp.]